MVFLRWNPLAPPRFRFREMVDMDEAEEDGVFVDDRESVGPTVGR